MCVIISIYVIYVCLQVGYSLVVMLHYLSLCYGMHGSMAVLSHLVILYAQLEHVPSQDSNLHHTHPICSIEVSLS
jgi:hypothetical protein